MRLSRSFASCVGARSAVAANYLLLVAAALLPTAAIAVPVCSTGTDGTVTVSTAATRVNVYFAAPDPTVAETIVPAGATSVPIDATLGGQASSLHPSVSTDIAAGDILIVMQMIGAEIDSSDNHLAAGDYGDGPAGLTQAGSLDNPNFTAGKYEFVIATGPIAGGVIPISGAGVGEGLLNDYVNSNVTTATLGFRRYQLIKVPQFSRLFVPGEIVSDRWNGRWGGISAVNVRENMNVDGGSFSANGRGFRGGQFVPGRSETPGGNFGYKGEGIAGLPQRLFSQVLLAEQPATGGEETGPAGYAGSDGGGPPGSAWTRDSGLGAPANAGSGGGGDAGGAGEDAGGGGGGNAARGGAGGQGTALAGSEGIGGDLFPRHSAPAPGRLIMGGGGGSSNGDDIAALDLTVSSGQAGGGVVFIRSLDILTIGGGAISADGDSGGDAASEGGGGGGAGGTVLIHSDNSTVDGVAFSAIGGAGGSSQNVNDGGGGGGSGGVIWLSDTTGGTATFTTNGGAGGTGASGGAFNGLAGGAGTTTSIGPVAEFDCNFVTLGIAKELVSTTDVNGDGTVFDLLFSIVVENFSTTTDAQNVQVIDDLDVAFPGVTSITLQGAPDLGGFTSPGAAYDGVTQTNLLAGSDTLAAGTQRTITYTVRVELGAAMGPFQTQAQVTSSQIPGGFAQVLDSSDAGADPDADGDGDPTETLANGGDSDDNEATVVNLDFVTSPAVCVFAPNPANLNDTVTATCTGVEPGGSVAIPGMACGPEAGGTVTCTGVASMIGSDPVITTSDAAGNMAMAMGDLTVVSPFDTDGDGVPDILEGTGDTDGDGTPDVDDTDSDNDGIPDGAEAPMVPALSGLDVDMDGIDDAIDVDFTGGMDANADGIDDATVPDDTDGDGTPDFQDLDSDNDAIPDAVEGDNDADGDGLPNYLDLDSDSDGLPDSGEADNLPPFSGMDADGDGIPDEIDADATGGPDVNGDGVDDNLAPVDTDGDGLPDYLDIDSDADGIPDAIEGVTDTDGDGVRDWRDVDADNDGILDSSEGPAGVDSDMDGIDDAYDADVTGQADADMNGIVDDVLSVDADMNGIPDADTDNDGIPDYRDLDSDNDGLNDVTEAGLADVDGNGLADFGVAPIGAAALPDADADGTPDFQEIDSDNDGTPDIAGTPDAALDANGDGRIDDPTDSDGDGLPDVSDAAPLAFGESVDADGDGITDIEEGIAANTDTDGDGTPDYLDTDSDNDGLPDSIESGDLDNDGIPDRIDVDGGELETAVSGTGSLGFLSLLLMLLAARQLRCTRRMSGPMAIVAFAGVPLLLPMTVEADGQCARDEVNGYFKRCFYGGIGGGITEVDPEGTAAGWSTSDDSSNGFKGFIGWQFKPHWSVELSYLDGGEAELSNINPAANALIPNAEIDYKTPSLMGLYWLREPDEDLNFFGKLGFSSIDNDASDGRIPFDKQTDVQIAGGLGLQWRFAKRWFVRGEGDFYDDDHYYAGLSIGAFLGGGKDVKQRTYGFPAEEPAQPPTSTAMPEPVPEPAAPAVAAAAPEPVCEDVVTTLDGVNFRTDSAALTDASRNKLSGLVNDISAAAAGTNIEVRAHTDDRGAESYNLDLSKRRAASVMDFLVEQGVDAARISATGYGEALPVADNETPEGRALNRRVEVVWQSERCR